MGKCLPVIAIGLMYQLYEYDGHGLSHILDSYEWLPSYCLNSWLRYLYYTELLYVYGTQKLDSAT